MAPSSRHLYPEWLRPRTRGPPWPPGGRTTGGTTGPGGSGQWLRAFDRRYATLVDLGLAVALFVLCSGWVVERTTPCTRACGSWPR